MASCFFVKGDLTGCIVTYMSSNISGTGFQLNTDVELDLNMGGQLSMAYAICTLAGEV